MISCYQQVIKPAATVRKHGESFLEAGQTPYALDRMAIEYSKSGDSFDLIFDHECSDRREALDRTIDKLVIDYNDFLFINRREFILRRFTSENQHREHR